MSRARLVLVRIGQARLVVLVVRVLVVVVSQLLPRLGGSNGWTSGRVGGREDSAGGRPGGLRGGWVVGGELGIYGGCGRTASSFRHGVVCGRIYLPLQLRPPERRRKGGRERGLMMELAV